MLGEVFMEAACIYAPCCSNLKFSLVGGSLRVLSVFICVAHSISKYLYCTVMSSIFL